MKTLVLANQKGGVGKSAVATLLAHYLVRRGRRVLAIDFDHQGNFSQPLRLSKRPVIASVTADGLMTRSDSDVPSAPFVLIQSDRQLLSAERQPNLHSTFATNLRRFVASVDGQFDVCIIDTNPNPDIRVVSALAAADYALSPIQLNREAMDGVVGLMDHERVGVRRIKVLLNPKLKLLGLLPTLVEPTPFQRANFRTVIERYLPFMISVGSQPGQIAFIPKRSVIAEAQAAGEVLAEMKKTAARDAWKEIEPGLARIASTLGAGDELAAG